MCKSAQHTFNQALQTLAQLKTEHANAAKALSAFEDFIRTCAADAAQKHTHAEFLEQSAPQTLALVLALAAAVDENAAVKEHTQRAEAPDITSVQFSNAKKLLHEMLHSPKCAFAKAVHVRKHVEEALHALTLYAVDEDYYLAFQTVISKPLLKYLQAVANYYGLAFKPQTEPPRFATNTAPYTWSGEKDDTVQPHELDGSFCGANTAAAMAGDS